MPDYSKIAASALATIRKSGKAFPISRPSTTFDSAGEPTEAEPATGELIAVSLPARKGTVGGFDIPSDEKIIKSRIIFLLAGVAGFVPELMDEITKDGGTYIIRGLQFLAPADTVLLYKIGAVKK